MMPIACEHVRWRWLIGSMLFGLLALMLLFGCQSITDWIDDQTIPFNSETNDPPVVSASINAAWFGTWFMSPTKSDEYRRTELARMRAAGMTAVYWCLNSVNGQLHYGVRQDEAYWRSWMILARDAGIEQVWLWIMDNRSAALAGQPDAWWLAMFAKVDSELGDLAHGYVLGLESEEYMSRTPAQRAALRASSRNLLTHLKGYGKPVGFHTSPGLDWVDYGKGVADFFFLQVAGVDTLTSEAEMQSRCRAAVKAFGGPVVAAEWARYERCGSDLNNRLGDAAIRADPLIVGVGGGCTEAGLQILRERAR